jgi:hypothetical protein
VTTPISEAGFQHVLGPSSFRKNSISHKRTTNFDDE